MAQTDIVRPLTPIHLSRFSRYKSGQTIEDIARDDKVTTKAVTNSIQAVEMFTQQHSLDILRSAEIQLIMQTMPLQAKALTQALAAKKQMYTEKGKLIGVVDDHEIRLQAIDRLNAKSQNVQPRGKGSTTSVTVGVGVAPGGGPAGSSFNFEERLRMLMSQRQVPQLQEGNNESVEVLAPDESCPPRPNTG